MSRFIYISDTHIGAAPMGFQQQRGYPEFLPRIMGALSDVIVEDANIDFVLHGGDMIDVTNARNLADAAELFRLPVPVSLCLGNHDLTEPDAADQWLNALPHVFPGGTPNFTISTDDCVIHVVPNHWQDEPFYWTGPQRAHFKPEQLAWLQGQVEERPDLPHIFATHSPTFGVPAEQTGKDEPFHCPGTEFTSQVTDIVARHPTIKCVLGAHSHINMCVQNNGAYYVTSSSLVETPFEFKLFEVTPEKLEMTTLSLLDRLDIETVYNPARSYTQGRPVDRAIAYTFKQ